jgi:DNA polymerase III delta prime subunit
MSIENTDPKNFVWCEKYRPNKIEDCILPERLKKPFQDFVIAGNIPNLLLSGSSGIGKTTVAKAMLAEIGADFIVVNGSMNGNIDTLRIEIQNFASTISLQGGRKFVILDEMDYLNASSTMPAMRNFFEQYSKNCGFIGTCNYKNRIIDPLKSRMTCIDFNISKKEIADLAPQFLKRVESILKNENVAYDRKVVAAVIAKFFPDWRRVLNELQGYSASGTIDAGILTDFSEERYKVLLGYMREKNFTSVRRWIGENEDISASEFYRKFYDSAYDAFSKDSVPQLVLTLADYQDKESRVADTQINRAAFAVCVMADCKFKE